MYENELARGNNVHLEAGDEGRGGANSWLATQPLWGAYSIRFERWTVIFSVNFDNIWEVLKVLESGSGEDLAVFCRSVISYCGKKGVEVKETIIRQKKIRQKWSGKNTQNCLGLTVDKRYSSQSEESVQLNGRKLGL